MPKPEKITPRTRTVPRTAWRPGQSGNPKGKPKGALNHTTHEVAAAAHALVTDETYRRNLLARLRAGTAGAIEVLLWHYAYGKPRETHDVHVERSDGDWTQLLTAKLNAIATAHDDAPDPRPVPLPPGGRLAR